MSRLVGLAIGQQVWIYDINARGDNGPDTGTVVKVGTKLVSISSRWETRQYRLDTGRINDNYGHKWFLTDEERADHEARDAALATLRAVGVTVSGSPLSTRQIVRMAAAIDDAAVSGVSHEGQQK